MKYNYQGLKINSLYHKVKLYYKVKDFNIYKDKNGRYYFEVKSPNKKFPALAFTSLVIALSMVGYAIYMTVHYSSILNLIK